MEIFLDTETTGLNPASDRLIELGLVVAQSRRDPLERYQIYFNPGIPIDPGATQIHGITDAMVAGLPGFKAYAARIAHLIRGKKVVIHNASFDCAFLDAEFQRAGIPFDMHAECEVVDTLKMSKSANRTKRHSLDALCDHYGISRAHREQHGALLDAELLMSVYRCMISGQSTLGLQMRDSHQLSGRLAEALKGSEGRPLVTIPASDAELQAHRMRMQQVAKISKKPVWDLDTETPSMS